MDCDPFFNGVELVETDEKVLSADAQIVLGTMTDEEKEAIQKSYPFREERDQVICKLRSKGVSVQILVELSGLSQQSISRISTSVKYFGHLDEMRQSSQLIKVLKQHKTLFGFLNKLANK